MKEGLTVGRSLPAAAIVRLGRAGVKRAGDVTAPSTIPTSNNTRTYTATRHSRIRTERIAASAYNDNRHTAKRTGAAEVKH